MRLLLAVSLTLVQGFLLSQKYDFQWLFGDDAINGNNQEIDNIQFDFNGRPVEIGRSDTIDLKFYFQRTAISDSLGQLLFYSNGCRVMNAAGETMANGDSLNPGVIRDSYCDIENGWATYPGSLQTMLALPQPRRDSIWYLFHISRGQQTTKQRLYSKINTNLQNGLGEVVEKNIVLDTLPASGKLNAVYSDNLNAWYVLNPKFESNTYDIYLLDSTGLALINQQEIGLITTINDEGAYITRFSPDGQVFASFNPLVGLELFDFDRGSGVLSNPRSLPYQFDQDSSSTRGGIEFSPNGRYLYVANSWYLEQYDLEAPTLEQGYQRIAILDSPDDEFFKPYFNQLQLGPDCRMYVFCVSCDIVHVIHRPDEAGAACMLEQRAIQTPSYYFRGVPIYPKYRMKALGDTSSICDHVTQTVFSSTSEVASEIDEVETLLYPNPASGSTRLVFSASLRNLNYQLFDGQGRELISGNREWLAQGIALPLDVSGLAAGIYHLRLRDGDGRLWARRLVVE